MRRSVFGRRVPVLMGLLACVAWCDGCGPDSAPTGSVSGKVTHKGKPLTAGLVLFVNEELGVGASAALDSSGNYQIPSIQTGDYQVGFGHPPAPGPEEVEKAEKNGAKIVIPKLDIPDKFLNPKTSGLTATVVEGDNTADFSL